MYRKEIKYRISMMDFMKIRKLLEAFMHLDEHGGDMGYQVRSLYFDSLLNRDLNDVLDGIWEKGKIRLRIYSHTAQTALLEFKRKAGSDGVKQSVRLPRDLAERLMYGDYSFLRDMDEPLARVIYQRMSEGAYHPVSIVEYSRIAYVYPVSDVRITYDYDIKASSVASAFFDASPCLFPIIPPDIGVFEVKYNDFLPSVLSEVVQRIDLMPIANSKYVQSRLFY